MLDIHSYVSRTIYGELFHALDIVAQREGATVFVVGGFVRDILLKKDIKDISDIDFVVFNLSFIDFAYKFADYTHNAAIPFKDNVRVLWKGRYIDISAPRGENIQEDLLKRDFTINNLAMDLSGNIYGDTDDIFRGIIRPVYLNSFTDDPIRILRGFRQAAKYNFSFDKLFFDLMKNDINKILSIPSERVIQELRLISLYPNRRVFLIMEECCLWNSILGVINSSNFFDIYTKCLPLLDSDEDAFPLLMASIIISSDKYDSVIFKRLPFSNKELALYKLLISVADIKGDVKRYVCRNYSRIDLLIEFAKTSSVIDNSYAAEIMDLKKTVNYAASELVTGDDILAKLPNSIRPGRWIGVLIEDIKTKLIFNELYTKRDVEDYIDTYIKELNLDES